MAEPLEGRVVVISPHLDDGVFSLGATIANATCAGSRVEVLTVFGCDPGSLAPANGWDTRGGFETEGSAARMRREEDRAACGLVGAEPHWLSFRGSGYTPHKDGEAIRAAIAERLSSADTVLVPGFPLRNHDHAWLAGLLAEYPPPGTRVGRYVEQPYAYMVRRQEPRTGAWTKPHVSLADQLRKRRAVREYRSQLPLLSLGAARLHLMLAQGEGISWSAG